MLQPGFLCRNGQVVGVHTENAMRKGLNQILGLRGKELFAYAGPLTNIPGSDLATRVRWRFSGHTSQSCQRMRIHVIMALTETVDFDEDSYVIFDEPNFGTLEFHYGSGGPATDVPSEFAEFHGFLDVDTDSDIEGEFSEVNGARLVSAVVYEEMGVPDTTLGFILPTGAGGNILDADRSRLATMLESVWYTQGSQVWNWTADTDANAFVNTSNTFKNLADTTVTTVSAASPGATIDMTGKTTLRQESTGVPVTMKVYASAATQTGVVKLVDSGGTTVISQTISVGAAAWYSVDGVLPASSGKYDLQGALGAGGAGTLTVYAVSIYEEGITGPYDVDVASGVAKPSTLAQYTAWRAASGISVSEPDSLFNCTETSANADLADSIGSRTLARNGTTVGAQAVSGWTATGVKVTNTATSWWQFTGEDLSTTDVAAFAILDPNTVSLGTIISFGGGSLSNATEIELLGSGLWRARRGSNTVDSAISYTGPTAVFVVCRQSASDFSVYLKPVGSGSIETLTPTWSAPPSGASTFYFASGWETASVDATFLELSYWTGTGAAITSAQVSAFITARGA